MNFHFAYRRYCLALRAPVRTAQGIWTEREGILVKLQRADGAKGDLNAVGYGEAAVLPTFGTETVEEVELVCREWGDRIKVAQMEGLPARFRCLRHALATAREAAESRVLGEMQPAVGVAALVSAGPGAIKQIREKGDSGFRVFKWKVGVGDRADELSLLADVCAALPEGGKLRLDANGAWDRRWTERWLERCAERPVEFLEQPIAVTARGADDVLRGLANDWPTPLALDESLGGDGDIQRWIELGWPGVFVVKLSLLADVVGALARLEKAKAKVVFSSALETAVGAKAALRVALAWNGEPRALGFGVWPLFADRRFDGPAAAPFLRSEDVSRIDEGAVWNALS